jgi:hypothetical protein
VQLENMHFSWIPEPAYKLFKKWYGVFTEFPRKVVTGPDGGTRIEAYPQICIVKSSTADAGSTRLLLPRSYTARNVLDEVIASDSVLQLLCLAEATSSSLRVFALDTSTGEENAWALLANDVTIDDVARNDPQTTLLIELRDSDGSWPRGPIYASGYEPLADGKDPVVLSKWRESLKVGTYLDAQDKERVWWDACIVKLSKPLLYGEDDLTVHYRCWASTFDEVKARSSSSLKPLYSETKPWRQALRPGDPCEILFENKSVLQSPSKVLHPCRIYSSVYLHAGGS